MVWIDNKISVLAHQAQQAALQEGIEVLVGAGVIVLRQESSKYVLLLHRPPSEFMGGISELPSGKQEAGESIVETAIRETTEETGLLVTRVTHYLGHFDYISGSGKRSRQFNFILDVDDYRPVQLTEHEGYSWVQLPDLSERNITDEVSGILSEIPQ